MNISAVETYLNAWWSELIAEALIEVQTILNAVQGIYDAQPTLDPRWANYLAKYYLLERAVAAFSVDFDVTVEGDSYRLSQRKDLAKQLAEAHKMIAWIVEPLSPEEESIGQLVTVTGHVFTGDPYRGSGEE